MKFWQLKHNKLNELKLTEPNGTQKLLLRKKKRGKFSTQRNVQCTNIGHFRFELPIKNDDNNPSTLMEGERRVYADLILEIYGTEAFFLEQKIWNKLGFYLDKGPNGFKANFTKNNWTFNRKT